MTPLTPLWLDKLKGRFLVFDGPDGSGKSTQFRRFSEYIGGHGLEVCEVREPGGTGVGEAIRQLLLEYQDQTHGQMDAHCEMLLFMASRAQLVAEQINPAKQAGKLVLADRFISSTLAYQGAAGGVKIEDILRVGKVAVGETWADLVVVFDVDEQTAAGRLSPLLDRMEQKGAAYHRQVRQGYLDQAAADPEHYLVINACGDAGTVFDRLIDGVSQRLVNGAGFSR